APTMRAFPACALMSVYILSVHVRYQRPRTRPRVEARIGGTADPVAARCPPPARLRPEQVDRDTVGRPAEVPHRFPLPVALSPRRTWLDRGQLGREARRTPPPPVQTDP